MLESVGVSLLRAGPAHSQMLIPFFFAEMERELPASSPQRLLLSQRRVVVALSTPSKRDPISVWDRECTTMDGYKASAPTYYHIGNPVFSPFGATFKRLSLAPAHVSHRSGEVDFVINACVKR